MSQKCVVVARINPAKPNEAPKFYALAKSNKNVTVDGICARIAERSSYSRGELVGTISEFLIEVQHVLEEGNITEMSTLGNFSLRARTKTPTDTAAEFKAANILDAKVRFYPGESLRNLCKTIKFEVPRSTSDKTENGDGSGNTNPAPDENEGGGGIEGI